LQVGGKIRALRKSRDGKMTSTDLARKAEISQSYVTEIEGGKKNPSLEVLSRIAKALEVSLSEILTGASQPPVPAKFRYVPVIDDASCGLWLDVGDLDFPPGFGAAYELTDSPDPNAFYVIAKGDGMVGGRIQEGDYLLVSPNTPCASGDIVLARTEQGVMARRYNTKGDTIHLEPLNPDCETSLSDTLADTGYEPRLYKVAEIKIKL
jgi:SOS-response transcriptional repressor LexA